MMSHFSPGFLILRLLNEQKNSGPAGLCLPLCPELKSPCYAPKGRSTKMCWFWFFNIGAKINLQIQPSPSVHPEPQNKAYFLLNPHRASALETWLGTGVDCVSRKHCAVYLPLTTLTKDSALPLTLPRRPQGDDAFWETNLNVLSSSSKILSIPQLLSHSLRHPYHWATTHDG